MRPFSSSIRDLRHSLNMLAMLALLALTFVIAGCVKEEEEAVKCDAGEMPAESGGCQSAGVPPDACGQGFEADGQGGCDPILPEDPCPQGQMAVPGDIQCHEVASCGTSEYGAIPRQNDATTQFVNGSYPGIDGNGTKAKPWRFIQDGINHAKSGAIVAVAAGSYKEDLLIKDRPVQLWGRCPALVEVVGSGEFATLRVLSRNSSRSEIHYLAITGPGIGITMRATSDVFIDHDWIHDTTVRGIDAADELGPTSFRTNASLIEATKQIGVFVAGSDATIEATVVRGAQRDNDEGSGHGIEILNSEAQTRARLRLLGSLVEQNHEIGLVVQSSDATVENTVVRNTSPNRVGKFGWGIEIDNFSTTNERTTLTLRASLLDHNHEVGVLVFASDVTIEATVVRATQPTNDGIRGFGLLIQSNPNTNGRSAMALRNSLVEQNHEAGVAILGSDATIEGTLVRANQPIGDGTSGHGVAIRDDPTTHERSALMLRSSLVEQNHEMGVSVVNSDATLDSTVVRATHTNEDGNFGDGIVLESHGSLTMATITSSKIETNARAGISNLAAVVLLVSSAVQCNRIDLNGEDTATGEIFTFDGSKENLCGCEEPDPTCPVLSARLSSPRAIDPVKPRK